MANDPDDIYNDPQTIGDDDDTIHDNDELPEAEQAGVSQTPYLPEKDPDDTRGTLDEVDPDSLPDDDELARDHPEEADPDANKLNNADPADEHDGTEE